MDAAGDRLTQIGVLLIHAADAQHGVDPGQELGGIEGLGDVFVGAFAQPFDDRFRFRLRRDQDDGQEITPLRLLDTATDLETVHARHHDV